MMDHLKTGAGARRLTTPEEIAELIALGEAAGFGHHTPLLRAAAEGKVSVLFPQRELRMPPLWHAERFKRPVIVVLGDDDYQPAGPETWASASKLREWATVAIVHGSGGEASHYQGAVSLANSCRRLLFIETTSSATDAWLDFLQQRSRLRLICIRCSGPSHPVMPEKGELN